MHKEHPQLFEIDSTKILEQHQILLFLRGKFVEFIKQKMQSVMKSITQEQIVRQIKIAEKSERILQCK